MLAPSVASARAILGCEAKKAGKEFCAPPAPVRVSSQPQTQTLLGTAGFTASALYLSSRRRNRLAAKKRCHLQGLRAHEGLFGTPPAAGKDFPAPTGKAPPNGKTAIVVGAGVGGLALAGRLARAGFEVKLLEKNATVGGRMRSEIFEGAEGHRFDTGPSLLLFPDKYVDAFNALGARIEDHCELARVEPTAVRVHFAEDSTSLDLLYDSEAMRRQLEAEEPGAGKQYFRWLGEARASLDLGLKAFIEQDSTSALDFVDLTRVGPLALAVNPILLLGPQNWQLGTHFKSPKVKALFSYQHLYVGLSPYNAPGVFSLLAATELTDGIWYPKGGFATVRDGLQRLAEAHGVKLETGCEVTEIMVDKQAGGGEGAPAGRAKGVKLASGETLEADVVVANPDLPYVYEELLKGQYPGVDKEAAGMKDDLEYSCTVIEFCWALKEPLDSLTQHNVFLGKDYEGSWDRPCTVEDLETRDSFNFYVHRPTYTDPSAAPKGEDNLMILLPIGNAQERAKKRKGPEDEEALIKAGRAAVLRQFERMGHKSASGLGVEKLIKGERVISPSDWEKRYNLTHGAVFGLSHGLLQLACFRPPRQTGLPGVDAQRVENLHFVGASTRPGNGVPLVLMGVEITYENILAEQGVQGPAPLPPLPPKKKASAEKPHASSETTSADPVAKKEPAPAEA